jgi:ribosomal-protein-serine acetyltransferase
MLTLETPVPGLQVQQLRQGDAAAHYTVIHTHRQDLRTWLPWVDATLSVREVEGFIALKLTEWQIRQSLACALWWQGQIVGSIGIVETDHANARASIGYWLAPPWRGRGWMAAALRTLSHQCHSSWGFHRVELRAAVGNTASQRVAERSGFTREGVLRSACLLHGHFHDVAVYSKLAGEDPQP